MKLNVNEIFFTIQGEAYWTGVPSVFIRLQGCTVGCAWCDTKNTWAVDEEKAVNIERLLLKEQEQAQDGYTWAEMSVTQIIKALEELTTNYCHVVITGGEPLEQNIDELVIELVEQGHTVQIETSGTEEVSEIVAENAWVTVSPKMQMAGGKVVTKQAISKADEIKMPVGKEADIEALDRMLEHFEVNQEALDVWLQPLSQNAKSTELCIETAKERNWYLSMQLHKYCGVR